MTAYPCWHLLLLVFVITNFTKCVGCIIASCCAIVLLFCISLVTNIVETFYSCAYWHFMCAYLNYFQFLIWSLLFCYESVGVRCSWFVIMFFSSPPMTNACLRYWLCKKYPDLDITWYIYGFISLKAHFEKQV